MFLHAQEIYQTCQKIEREAREKAYVEINPLLSRVQLITKEIKEHLNLLSATRLGSDRHRFHLSVLYRSADILDEMYAMLQHTTPLPIRADVDFIMKSFVEYTGKVVEMFGRKEALYIVTPKFQKLSGLW